MQSVTPLYVSSVLPRFRDCSLVLITEHTHTQTRSESEYFASIWESSTAATVTAAHRRRDWPPQLPCFRRGSPPRRRRRRGRAPPRLFFPGYSGWQRAGSRWWKRGRPCTKKMTWETQSYRGLWKNDAEVSMRDESDLSSVAPRPL